MEIKTQTPLATMTIKEFAKSKSFVDIAATVRVNENGYPYITFIDKDNAAENIYFSRRASEAVAAGTPVTKELLKSYQIGITTNANGEERIKLVTNTERSKLADLLD